MYTIEDLNVRLISELKEIAEGMGINAKKLGKEELVYKILDKQAVAGEPTPKKKETQEPERKMRPRRRENVAPPVTESATPPAEEKSSEEMIKDPGFEVDQNITRFEETTPEPIAEATTSTQNERTETSN
jgi:transcription termination factor Rho